jgi:hypothetical protein
MFAASKSGSAADPTDPQFNYVTMLLHGDGTNGAQNNTFLDSSTNNFTITRNGNTTQGTFTPYGSNWSNVFNATTDKLTLTGPNLSSYTNFTFECWVNFNGFGADTKYFLAVSGGSYYQLVHDSSAGISLRVTGYTSVVGESSNAGWAIGTWYHVALVKNGSTYTIYKNGVSIATSTYTSALPSVTIGYIGGYDSTTGLNAYMSNTRITSTAVYTAAFTPPTAPLTAITNTLLLTSQSNRFVDNSASPYTLTVSGTPSVQRFSPFSPTTAYSTSVIGGSGYFDGSGDYLVTPSSSALSFGTSDFTMEMWVYSGANGTSTRLGGNGTGGAWSANKWILATSTGGNVNKFCLGVNNTGSDLLASTSTFNNNQWMHVAITRSGSSWAMFVNGTRESTATSSVSLDGGGSNLLNLGFSNISGDSAWAGYVSNFRAVIGTAVYSPSSTTITVPTAPFSVITNTALLYNFTNAGILDNAQMNDLETVGNAQISTSVKKYGTGSMYFDGTGDALYSNAQPNAFNTGDFTLEFWIYFNAVNNSTTKFVYDMRNSGATSASFLAQETDNSWTFWNGAGTQISTGFTGSTFAATTWTHVAICRSSGTTKFFVNGTQTNSVADTSSYANSTIVVGSRYNYANGLNAYIDDLRITKYARYTASFTAPTAAFADKG